MFVFTSESVTDGHPDKVCDQISDAILDAALSQDRHSKMAVEATIKDNFVLIYGEANTKATLDYPQIAREVLNDIGYTEDFEFLVKVSGQSDDIYQAVAANIVSAGDQGIMFGYACDDTPNYMPLAITLAHELSRRLKELRETISWIKPDGKTQVSVAYDDQNHPLYVTNIVISTQHEAGISHQEIEETMINEVIKKVVDAKYINDQTTYTINPSGQFIIGGPYGDSGTTGRKIIVDSYGGMGRIGGGCFSSKDPSKVDRSAAYYLRYVAKSIVAAGLAKRCEIQISYAIGKSTPQSLYVNGYQTSEYSNEQLLKIVEHNFDFSVYNIITELDLLKPIYRQTSNFGHFSNSDLPWEKVKTLDLNIID